MSEKRRTKDNYYLDIAETVAARSTCLQRKYGAIIVNNDSIISTGYTGAPRGRRNCCDIGICVRMKMGLQKDERVELCRAVHAEANAIISASRNDMLGSTLYIVGADYATGELIEATCCQPCKRLIINAGISNVIIRISKDEYKKINVRDWIYHDESLGEHANFSE